MEGVPSEVLPPAADGGPPAEDLGATACPTYPAPGHQGTPPSLLPNPAAHVELHSAVGVVALGNPASPIRHHKFSRAEPLRLG